MSVCVSRQTHVLQKHFAMGAWYFAFCLVYGQQQLLLVWHLYHISHKKYNKYALVYVCASRRMPYRNMLQWEDLTCLILSWVETANSYQKTLGKTRRYVQVARVDPPIHRVLSPPRLGWGNHKDLCRPIKVAQPQIGWSHPLVVLTLPSCEEDQDQKDLDNQSTSVDSPSANHSPKPNSKTPQKAQAVCHGTVRRNVVEILQQIVLARKPSTNDRELAHAMLNDRFNLLNLWLGECKSPRFPKVKSQNHEMLAD